MHDNNCVFIPGLGQGVSDLSGIFCLTALTTESLILAQDER